MRRAAATLARNSLGLVAAAAMSVSTATTAGKARAPALFVSHGAGPAFFMDGRGSFLAEFDQNSTAAKLFREIGANRTAFGLPAAPAAIVIVSAHWETSGGVRVLATPTPPLLYDYYGFPDSTYEITYPAPGSPALAQRVADMIAKQPGAPPVKLDTSDRGFDHGVFLPLKLLYPEGTVPVVQVSLDTGLDPTQHFRLGQALAPLRDENILIVASGEWSHPMATRKGGPLVDEFVAEAAELVTSRELSGEQRFRKFTDFYKDPRKAAAFRAAHNPEPEHFVPLFVAMGAAGDNAAVDLFKGRLHGKSALAIGAFSLASWVFAEGEVAPKQDL